jgi:hypothetical protein
MWSAVPTIRRKGDWNFGNAKAVHLRLDHHLQSELHAAALKLELLHSVFAKATEAAIKISATSAGKEKAPESGKKRIPEIAVKQRHCPWRDTPQKAVTHHKIAAFAKLLNKRQQIGKVVTEV